MSYLKTFVGVLILLTTTGGPVICKDVFYSGFAFSGNFADVQKNFPYTSKLAESSRDENGQTIFDIKTREFFKKNNGQMRGVNLLIGGERSQTKTAMAVTIVRENILKEQIGDIYKYVFNLYCNVVFLDFEEMKVLAAYPLYLEYIDARKSAPVNEDDYILAQMNSLYFSNEFSIMQLILERMSGFSPGIIKNRLSMRISNIDILPPAIEELTKYNSSYDENPFKSLVAQKFTDLISCKLGVSILPYAKDYVSGRMSLRFTDASVQNFNIPEASYSINLAIRKYVKKEHQKSNAEISFVYGIYTNVSVRDQIGNTYWDQKIKHGAVKVFPLSQKAIDDYSIYDELTGILLAKITKAMGDDNNLYKEVIQRCLNN